MMISAIDLPRRLDQLLRRDCAKRYPQEGCGLLIGKRGPAVAEITDIWPIENTAAMPAHRFEMSAAALVKAHKEARAAGQDIIGHYHSHPSGSAQPSDRDIEAIADPKAIWIIQAMNENGEGAQNAFAIRENSEKPSQLGFYPLVVRCHSQ